jgi:hypothetical protein
MESTVVATLYADVLSAYRAEMARRVPHPAIGEDDATWILIGTLLQHAAAAPKKERPSLLAELRHQIRALIGEQLWINGSPVDPSPPADHRTLAPRVRVLCEQIEDRDALILAETIARTYLVSGDPVSSVERGRFEALLARVAWKRGDHNRAESHYEQVAMRAKRLRSPELEARSILGRAILARLSGNYPASRTASQRVIAVAEPQGLAHLAAMGHQTSMIACVRLGDLNTAVQHAWKAYLLLSGDHAAAATQLADLAQLFADMGHYDVSAAGFTAALHHPLPTRLLLPALGGATLVAALRGDVNRAGQYSELAQRYGDATVLPYATASSVVKQK